MGFDDLASDLCISIYEFLSLDALAQLIVTNKEMEQLLRYFLRDVITAVTVNRPTPQTVKLVSHCRKLISLRFVSDDCTNATKIQRYKSCSEPLLAVIDANSATLELISLDHFFCHWQTRWNELQLFQELAKCNRLRYFDCRMAKEPLHLGFLPKTLLGLRIDSTSMQNLRTLRQFDHLRGVSLSLYGSPDHQLVATRLAALSSLEYLHLYVGVHPDDRNNSTVWNLPHLRHLRFFLDVFMENDDDPQLLCVVPRINAPLLQIVSLDGTIPTALEELSASFVDCPSLSVILLHDQVFYRSATTHQFVLQSRRWSRGRLACTRSPSFELPLAAPMTEEEHLLQMITRCHQSACLCCPLPVAEVSPLRPLKRFRYA